MTTRDLAAQAITRVLFAYQHASYRVGADLEALSTDPELERAALEAVDALVDACPKPVVATLEATTESRPEVPPPAPEASSDDTTEPPAG